MSIEKKTIRIMLIITVILSAAIGVFRAFLLLNHIEPETGFYIGASSAELIFNICMAVILFTILTFGFLTRKVKTPQHLDSHSMVVVFTSSLCAFMYFSVFLYGAYTIISGFLSAKEQVSILQAGGYLVSEMGFFGTLSMIAPDLTSNGILFTLQILLCPLCFMNHFTICSKEIREKNRVHSIYAMAEAIFFAIRIVEVFMNTKAQINTSQRSIELLMLCAMMLFFLFEAGFLVERTEGENSLSKYVMASLATVALPLIALLPYTAVSLFSPQYESGFIIMDVLLCCTMLFAASRLLTLNTDN